MKMSELAMMQPFQHTLDAEKVDGSVARTSDEQDLKGAAQSFEALLVNEMLKSMRRAAGLGDKPFGESVFTAMLDEKFAQNIAESGSFGLAERLVQQIDGLSSQEKPQSVDGPSEGFDVSEQFEKGGPS